MEKSKVRRCPYDNDILFQDSEKPLMFLCLSCARKYINTKCFLDNAFALPAPSERPQNRQRRSLGGHWSNERRKAWIEKNLLTNRE